MTRFALRSLSTLIPSAVRAARNEPTLKVVHHLPSVRTAGERINTKIPSTNHMEAYKYQRPAPPGPRVSVQRAAVVGRN